jgi:hypothetical protein
MAAIRFREWESKAAFRAQLDAQGERTIVVGRAAESPRRFYSCVVESAGGSIEVAVVSSDLGSVPAGMLLDGGRVLIVGHDAWLSWVDIEERRVTQDRRLGGVFFEFLPVSDDEVVVLHELGAIRVDARGGEVWNVDTDIVEGHRFDAVGNLILSVMDESSPVVVSIESGQAQR